MPKYLTWFEVEVEVDFNVALKIPSYLMGRDKSEKTYTLTSLLLNSNSIFRKKNT